MDWASRYVLSWEVSVTMDDDFCVNAFKSALRRHKPLGIFDTNQGAQYTGKAFTGALKDHGVQISMDGKGRCMDNIFIESWRSEKYEKIFLKEFETVQELLSGLKEYFEFYNFERPHQQSLAGKIPAEIYWGREVAKKAA